MEMVSHVNVTCKVTRMSGRFLAGATESVANHNNNENNNIHFSRLLECELSMHKEFPSSPPQLMKLLIRVKENGHFP